jgi:glycosyltransferase involved in cell wall biosynthesis
VAPLPFATVVVPARNEEAAIRACLEGLLAQDLPHDRFEVIVLDGGSVDATRKIVAEVAAKASVQIRLEDNPRRSVPAALNRALDLARGDYLVRVDAHSVPEPNYVRRNVESNVELGAELVGGWVRAVGGKPVQRAVAAAFASPFAMGNAGSWRRPPAPREVASVPCGSYRIDALRAIGGFDEAQLANQDYEANYRLRRAGGRVFILPDVSFAYIPRDTFRGLARQFVRYGWFKARTMAKHPASIRARHLVPAAGLVGLAGLVTLAPLRPWPLLAAVVAYAAGLAVASVRAGRGLGRAALLLPAVFATMHAAWALGNLAGLVRWPFARPWRD